MKGKRTTTKPNQEGAGHELSKNKQEADRPTTDKYGLRTVSERGTKAKNDKDGIKLYGGGRVGMGKRVAWRLHQEQQHEP